ncbi:pentapeptide repeat-containing protein [Rhizobium leguminosarum]|uniref:pentapeptide repeat-containing protein n=1 Tax=Rhizobium leguminosarum TaxID=384 RepID=UPI00103077A1|nr:pentapeptide repeat-containing protein [Rhizobium leguminosarum]TBG37135.1 pentapeptide repeat-containing protein [Rhizobium leguminosarum]
MKFNIMHRFNGSVIFAAEINCGEDEKYSIKLRLAVVAALAAKADLSEADLSWADLSKADLSEADLSWADLSWADLSEANLSEADLSKANLSWADLSEADLSKANLSEANLSEADLSKANLSEADLSWADLSEADLSEADLSWADLSEADLSKANLSEADLSWANLSEANLSEADLSWADLRYIKHDIWGVLLNAIPEVPALRQALVDGKVDGSQYSGECACLCGTIANVRHCNYSNMAGIQANANSLAERFFLAIRPGCTPENHQPAKLVVEWIDEFMGLIAKVKPMTGEVA